MDIVYHTLWMQGMRRMRKRFLSFLLAAVLPVLAGGLFVAAHADGAMGEILSGYYGIDTAQRLIGTIPVGTEESVFLSRCIGVGEFLLSDGIRTGSVLSLSREGVQREALTLAVHGDISGDGAFSITDMLEIKANLLGLETFSAAQAAAADVNADGSATITDFLQMKSALLQIYPLCAKPVYGVRQVNGLLLSVGETAPYGAAGDPVTVEGDAVHWADGVLTAVHEGVARVTNGAESVLVTVCSQGLLISIREPEAVLSPGDTALFTAQLNHPVQADFTWTCADGTIAQIAPDGTVTAVAEGETQVRATLDNGMYAEASVRVLPLIRSITLSSEKIKLRHGGGSKTLTITCAPAESREQVTWASSDPSVASVDGQGVVTAGRDGTCTVTCTSQYGRVMASCQVKVCDLTQVALTFDDGPSSSFTANLLDTLKSYGVRVTFFLVGRSVPGNAAVVRRMAEEGHELGYHTWAHGYLYNMSNAQMQADFASTSQVIRDACGQGPTVFRAPGGGFDGRVLSQIPLPHIHWSVDTRDWETLSAGSVKNAILNGVKSDGAIILLHDIHGTTLSGVIQALKVLMDGDADVEFLTVTELLSRGGTPPRAGISYRRAP